MKIGFTGTRSGMTESQKAVVRSIFTSVDVVELHHGDCVGADADAHDLAQEVKSHITIHPPVDDKLRAYKTGHEVCVRKTHFARNRDIVDKTELLIATPYTMHEEDRGGTWYTVNYARKKKIWLVIVWPDGSITEEVPL